MVEKQDPELFKEHWRYGSIELIKDNSSNEIIVRNGNIGYEFEVIMSWNDLIDLTKIIDVILGEA